MKDEALRKSFEAGGFQTLATTDAVSAGDYVKKEIARWRPILEAAGLRN